MKDAFWPDGAEAAVSLTFDDGLISQLREALPRLDDGGLRGTFYVNPGRSPEWEDLSQAWREAGLSGHEIGNHTTRHPCSCNFGFDSAYCLEKLSLDDITATIDECEAQLDALLPEQRGKRSYCYPCYQGYVGAGASHRSYVPEVARRFRAARGGGERTNNPRVVDLSYVWAWAVEGATADDMIAYVEQAASGNGWAIICMHGIGSQHISIDSSALGGLVRYLMDQRGRIWTEALIGVADHIIARRQDLGIAPPG